MNNNVEVPDGYVCFDACEEIENWWTDNEEINEENFMDDDDICPPRYWDSGCSMGRK